MQLTDFDFLLPDELIAQVPATQRDGSRLLCLKRQSATIAARQFVDIPEYFERGDVLVINDTKVIPARLLGQKLTGGKVEIFLVRKVAGVASTDADEWLCLTKSSKPLRVGTVVQFTAEFSAEVLDEMDAPYRLVRFHCPGDFMQMVDKVGHLPLPPYIKRDDSREDRSRYQTVFANQEGAVAAPTAGLHFTTEILQQLTAAGVEIVNLTLHVGLGTFLPVRVDDICQHKMHSELYSISAATAAAVNLAHQEGRRVFALGTTSARALETAATADGLLRSGAGESEIFIYPGYKFKIVDALITNFHLPKSTLLMLVSAFAGREFILTAYRQAIEKRFRFFSYGDCMLIL
ncbi:S-adenosylmethionine--tRNA ribosyltransferase-isomerase [Desulfuromusa kysingii]|uniref:S-adenosylmethionine:tRNA ribosyltransferase-isomerase n=1 Tax=Desulfuromusa kysingii TaxID=37625 RepID=A0A1H3YDA1_9BACT|nr:tRNA preQ1(34) S-adenosylmethionine ribosyltransferase-isomerase QueA [Desulfuromusa kysingii]SEA09051.1 S-adenosylmethionine--tRNA ribosyltransferase-isomerase [Desulfuromusa kysingii]